MKKIYKRDSILAIAGNNHPTDEQIQRGSEAHAYHRSHNHDGYSFFPFNNDYGYDIECYPNYFSLSITHIATCKRWKFEISNSEVGVIHQGKALFEFLVVLREAKARMVGFNNMYYDYPLVHFLMEHEGLIDNAMLYARSKAIIKTHDIMEFTIWNPSIQQVDLRKIHHFDNQAKMTSLKMLEFQMRCDDIQELPYDPNFPVTRPQIDHLLDYNDFDVDVTVDFYIESLPHIEFRAALSEKYGKDFTNHNDTKIGKDYFIMELAKHGIPVKQNGQLIQTHRKTIALNDIILPYVQFERPEFNEVLDFFRGAVMNPDNIKGFFKGVSCTVDGFKFDFGAGGIHGSKHKTIVRESATHKLIDVDVASYYPNLAIANSFYPEHLSDKFCDIYLDVYNQRKSFAKKTPENAMLKLALNGVYGDSNSIHSPFYDPQYTMSITINGQLLLCMLAEQLMKIEGFEMVQINTDGLTFLCPNEYVDHMFAVCRWWEEKTKLVLEDAHYTTMAIRDVNSYLAVTTDGYVKRIGAYAYELASENPSTRELQWHKNQSCRVVAMAAEAALVHNKPIPEFIRNHQDKFDFMLRTKVPRSSRLELRTRVMWGDDYLMDNVKEVQRITRYCVTKTGGKLVKVMPYTEKQLEQYRTGQFYEHKGHGAVEIQSKPKSGMWLPIDVPPNSPMRIPAEREIGINTNWLVTDCSKIENYNRDDLNYDFYIAEARSLVDELFV